MSGNGHGAALGTMPEPGARYRFDPRDGRPPAEFRVRHVVLEEARPVRGELIYHPDHAGNPSHGSQPYACDIPTLDRIWRRVP